MNVSNDLRLVNPCPNKLNSSHKSFNCLTFDLKPKATKILMAITKNKNNRKFACSSALAFVIT